MVGLKATSNGCGACGGFWKWFKPPHHNFFKNQCEEHDNAYTIGGSESDRLIADKKLFKQMIYFTIEYFKDTKISSQYWYITLSYLYYIGVRIFGKSQFNYNNEK